MAGTVAPSQSLPTLPRPLSSTPHWLGPPRLGSLRRSRPSLLSGPACSVSLSQKLPSAGRPRQLKCVLHYLCPTSHRHRPSLNRRTTYVQHASPASSRSSCSPPSAHLPMCYPPPEPSVRAILEPVVGDLVVERIRTVASLHPQRIYEVRIANGRTLVLVLAPASMLRLLRSEQWLTRSEAVVVRWLREVLDKERESHEKMSKPVEAGQGMGAKSDSKCEQCQQRTRGSSSAASRTLVDPPEEPHVTTEPDLLDLLPVLVAQSSTNKEFGSAYNIFEHVRGQPASSLPIPLTPTQRRHVDRQLGRLAARLARIKSPSGRFGPALNVLSVPTTPQRLTSARGPSGSNGAETWSTAFHSVLEGILRDGEDMAVNIQYAAIRRNFRRLGHILDAVTVPRLVVLDATEDSNVLLVSAAPTISASKPRTACELGGERHHGRVNSEGSGKWLQGAKDKKPQKNDANASQGTVKRDQDDDTGGAEDPTVVVAGLRDWSNAIFGDPLLATVFRTSPSAEFLAGFAPTVGDGDGDTISWKTADVIEGKETVDVRLLLYRAYHATVCVVKEFYRPQRDGMGRERELAARRQLNVVLAELDALVALEAVENDPKGRHRRPSGEMSPAKKLKLDGDGKDGDDRKGMGGSTGDAILATAKP